MLIETFRWYLTIEAIGLLALPVVYIAFQRLPGRGFAFAKPTGLLLAGFSYWFILSLHLMPNRPGTIIWAMLPLAIASALILRKHWREMRTFAEENRAYLIAVEVLFFVAIFLAAHLKSYIPEIAGTEKPMDFMMLNAASRSEYYPPDDPWLAGAGVSYYYFGYVIQAMIAKLSAMPTAVAFNLALAGTAALAATAAFGLGYEIARLVRGVSFKAAIATGAGAVLLLAVMGNLVGVVEFGIANGVVGPQINETVQINDLETAQVSDSCLVGPPGGCIKYPSDESSYWWWWRSTRVSSDGNSINEFPFFSFLLGDLHPHVMAIPFVLTVFGLGLALWSAAGRLDLETWQMNPWLLLFSALVAGGLGFLNTWDLPTFGFLLLALVLARNYRVERQWQGAIKDTLSYAAPLLILSFILYSPFYFSFSSQAAGLDTVVNGATRPLHSALFWGALVAVNMPLPFVLLTHGGFKRRSGDATVAFAVPVVLVLLWAALTVGSEGFGALADAISARGFNWLTYLFFAAGLAGSLLALRRLLELEESLPPVRPGRRNRRRTNPADDWQAEETPEDPQPLSVETRLLNDAPSLIPALIAMSTALLLILGAELFYVQDVFGSRLNTVFKLSYQAWLLLAVSGAYSLWWLTERWQPEPGEKSAIVRGAWTATAGIVLIGAMLYPLGATLSRTSGLNKEGRTLDGLRADRLARPTELSAIDWLRDRAGISDRIIEGMGGQYSASGRVSASTGVPTILGWLGHEVQWGRDAEMLTARSEAVDTVYTTESLAEAVEILQQYEVSYVFVGSVERAKYPPEGLTKFIIGLPIAAEFGDTVIYRVPRREPDAGSADVP